MWIICGLQVDSTWTPWTLRCYRCTNTWTPPGIQVYSSKTLWMLPGVHLESRWSPPQPVARYNNLWLGGALFKIVDRLGIAHRTCKLILLGFSQFMADLYYIRLVTSLAIMHQITTVWWSFLPNTSRNEQISPFHLKLIAFSRICWFMDHNIVSWLCIRCLAHVINLATQALIKGHSKAKYYSPAKPDEHIPDVDAFLRDEVGLVRAIAVKVSLFLDMFQPQTQSDAF